VGDAGFFVDPCFSSGVHLALRSAELAVQAFLRGTSNAFSEYERILRDEEQEVTNMVKHFYNVSRAPRLQRLSARISDGRKQVLFNTFVGGDFTHTPGFGTATHNSLVRLKLVSGVDRTEGV
jgi:flavin-dependent dehydrogenase